ncbi:unnamed protein product [Ectocarpus sp. CCAP 1310/34]|nr:unnamed protein product [Ectocarpus sp. CCAP 1310/34]
MNHTHRPVSVSRQLDKAAKALPVTSRRTEDELRRAFFAEVGAVLAALGAAPALRAPKKLQGDAGVCFRAVGFLAARVSSHQRRRKSAPEAAPAPAPASTGPTPSINTSGNTLGVGSSGGRDTNSVSNNNGEGIPNTNDTGSHGGSNHKNSESTTDTGGGVDRSAGRFDGGASSSSLSLTTSGGGGPSPTPLRTAGLRTAHTPRPSRRKRSLPAGARGAGNAACERAPPFAVAGVASAAAAPTEEVYSLSGNPKGPGGGGGGGGGGTGAGFYPGAAAGGVFGDAALPAWRQVLDHVKDLSRRLRWAERAAQKAADGRIHVGQSTGMFLSSPHLARGGGGGQRRPRDIRLRALDPDHFTCPPPAHGESHHRRAGASPAEGHASVLLADDGGGGGGGREWGGASPYSSAALSLSGPSRTPPGGASGGGGVCSRAGARAAGGGGAVAARAAEGAAAAAAEAAATAASVASDEGSAVPEVRGMYHLDAPSLQHFEEAAAAATRALEALLVGVTGGDGGDGGGGGGRAPAACASAGRLPLPATVGVGSLLLPVARGGYSGGEGGMVKAIAEVRDTFRGLVVAAAALGVAVPCSPEGAGAASDTSSAPCLRLLRGVKAAGGTEGARRLEALARRLGNERAALERAAAEAAAEAREWRAAAGRQASAVLSLAQVGKGGGGTAAKGVVRL